MARLTDFLINDNDRHSGQWKWARFSSESKTEWQPIARDRDHAFVSYDGVVGRAGRMVKASLVSFTATPERGGLTAPNDIDQRLLSGLEKPVWDSIALDLQARVTDAVINAAAMAMPVEYRSIAPHMEAVLIKRRAAIPTAADEYYRQLAARVQVNGTDSADRATIVRTADGVGRRAPRVGRNDVLLAPVRSAARRRRSSSISTAATTPRSSPGARMRVSSSE